MKMGCDTLPALCSVGISFSGMFFAEANEADMSHHLAFEAVELALSITDQFRGAVGVLAKAVKN